MATLSSIGISRDQDSYHAGVEAATLSLKGLMGKRPNALFVFASSHYDQQKLIDGVRHETGDVPLAGATAASTMTQEGIHTNSVVVMALSSDSIKFSSALAEDIRVGAREAGRKAGLAFATKEKEARRLFIMFSDILAGDGEALVRGALDSLGAHFPVVGASAADGFTLEKTHQFSDALSCTGALAAMGLSGAMTIGIGAEHGWVPIGLPMRVTKAAGTVIQGLDGRPAVSMYEDYFGKSAEELIKGALLPTAITYPFGIKVPGYDKEYLVRDPLSVDDDGGITVGAEIPEGTEVRIMIGSKDRALIAAKNAAEHAMQEFRTSGSSPKFAFVFSSVARQRLLGSAANDELKIVESVIGPGVPITGFYSYGTWAPLGGEIRDPELMFSRFSDQMIVVCIIGE